MNNYHLPDFLRKRVIRPLYVLIYGREKEGNRFIKNRSLLAREDEILMTYDSISPDYETQNLMTVKVTPKGYEAIAIPPTFTLSPELAKCRVVISKKKEAASNNNCISPERKEFLIKRFFYWDKWILNGGDKTIIHLRDEE